MFTVLIAEKKYIDAIRHENKLFFEPFLDSKDIAFCNWNPNGENIQDAVPGLLDAVGRKKDWRAVIINNCDETTTKFKNPFDVVEHSVLDAMTPPQQQLQEDESMEHWENSWSEYYSTLAIEKEKIYKEALTMPLQKLTTWLCFKPENYVYDEVKAKQDVDDWAMQELGRDDMKTSAKLEIMEREQYKYELKLKENLRRSFLEEKHLNVNYPAEVYCISPRAIENNYFDPGAYWNLHQDNQYSSFADRNMYFDKMRFVVFDILPSTHRDYRTDYIRFLASLLIFATNPIPSSSMQSRRLYRLEVETDDEPLCTLITSYDKKLSNTYDVITNEMEKIKSEIPEDFTDKAAEALFCTPKDVVVSLAGECDSEKMYAEKDYGLFFDSPEDEQSKWMRDYDDSKKELTFMAKQQLRAVRKTVGQVHLMNEVSDLDVSRLTSFQLGDVSEYTDNEENVMVESIPDDIEDLTNYYKRIEKASDRVQKVINRRMTCKTGVVLSLVCFGLFLLSCIPFFFNNNATSQTITASIIMTIVCVVILALILLIALLCMRSTVIKAIKNYNNIAKGIVADIHASMKQFSKYLSAMSNVSRGHKVQNYAGKNLDEYTRSLTIRKKHQEEIRKKRAELAENYGDYMGGKNYCDEMMANPYEYDFDETKVFEYAAPFLAGDSRQIEFISGGNMVTVPSSYVKRILVRMEEIYEK